MFSPPLLPGSTHPLGHLSGKAGQNKWKTKWQSSRKAEFLPPQLEHFTPATASRGYFFLHCFCRGFGHSSVPFASTLELPGRSKHGWNWTAEPGTVKGEGGKSKQTDRWTGRRYRYIKYVPWSGWGRSTISKLPVLPGCPGAVPVALLPTHTVGPTPGQHLHLGLGHRHRGGTPGLTQTW